MNKIELQKCNSWSERKDVLNVHLICHTHDDPGWIKTIDQYYYGCRLLIDLVKFKIISIISLEKTFCFELKESKLKK